MKLRWDFLNVQFQINTLV